MDKLANEAKLRRANFKGGRVPMRMHKVHVEYYKSDDDENDDKSESQKIRKAQSSTQSICLI